MSSSSHVPHRTRLFARVIGPYLLLTALSLSTRPDLYQALMKAFSGDAAWPWIAGAFGLPMGLVVIALHPYWRGPAAFLVSLLGWLTAFKGLALMTFPQRYLTVGQDVVGARPWWQISVVVMGLIGLYLSMVGWAPFGRRSEEHLAGGHLDRDLRHVF